MPTTKTNKPHTKKLQTIIISLLLSVVVWFMVTSLTNPSITTTISNLNVRFVGEAGLRERQLAIIGRKNIPSLSVVVSGNRSDLMNFMDDIYVQVDVSNINTAGDYTLTGTITVPTTRINVEKENFSDIPITVEALVTKDVEVTVKQTGTKKNKLVQSVIRNPFVKITGAESEMEQVEAAVATIDISNAEHEPMLMVNYILTDASGTLVTENETLESARSEVEIENTVYDAVTLPVKAVLSGDLELDYTLDTEKTSISPSSVTVGILPGNTFEAVTVAIDEPSGEEREYILRQEENMYIPAENKTVRVKPFMDQKVPNALISDDAD